MNSDIKSKFRNLILTLLFIYVLLYCSAIELLESFWSYALPIIVSLFGSENNVASVTNGSGDTLFDYYLVMFFVSVSIIAGIVFCICTKRQTVFNFLHPLTLLILRYFLAYQMISYGLAKIFPMQFPKPSSHALGSNLGDFTPMALLWSFMGHSKYYCIFTGSVEVLAGLLLLSKRTTLLGALIAFGAMTNIFILNLCYDVPVKLFSFHLLVFSILIMSYWSRNLIDFFIFNRQTKPLSALKNFIPQPYQLGIRILKWLSIILFLGYSISDCYNISQKIDKDKFARPLLSGVFDVVQFNIYRANKNLQNPAAQVEWRTIQIGANGHANIELLKGIPYNRFADIDTLNKSITFKYDSQQIDGDEFTYAVHDNGMISLQGTFKKDSLSMLVQNKNSKYNLLNTKFKWIHEYPNNRIK